LRREILINQEICDMPVFEARNTNLATALLRDPANKVARNTTVIGRFPLFQERSADEEDNAKSKLCQKNCELHAAVHSMLAPFYQSMPSSEGII